MYIIYLRAAVLGPPENPTITTTTTTTITIPDIPTNFYYKYLQKKKHHVPQNPFKINTQNHKHVEKRM
jgi:hypothetical protein